MSKTPFLTAFVLIALPLAILGQSLANERALHLQILKELKKDVKDNYYDPNLKGIDLDSSVKTAQEYVAAAKSVGEMDDAIARVLIQFDDSHLGFIPPATTILVDYGWKLKMIGDKAFVTNVAADSDAFKKGIRPGDQIYMLEGFIPSRNEFWLLKYHFQVLSPQPKLSMIIIKPSGNKYQVEIAAKLETQSAFRPETRELEMNYEREFDRRTHQSFYDGIPGISIWKIPIFEFSDVKVAKMMDRVKRAPALILDLRGNHGGHASSLDDLIAAFFDRDVVVGEIQRRKKTEQMIVRGSGKSAYKGKLVVLIDSESSSASEIFARTAQVEKRGFVIGDQSSGEVMESAIWRHYYGLDSWIGYSFRITVGSLVMKDGKSLEKVGVTPDEKLTPTAQDLAAQRDPVLARAIEFLGSKVTAEDAGKIFPDDFDRRN